MIAYLITNLITGRVYVGITRNALHTRWRQHLYVAYRGVNTSLAKAIRKYGAAAFSVEEIACAATHEDLLILECLLIAQYQATSREFGYNLTDGGESRAKQTAEWSARQSAAATGRKHTDETKSKLSRLMKGHVNSPETVEKIKIAKIGYRHSDETKTKIGAANRLRASCRPPVSDETRQKMSKSHAGMVQSEESKARVSAAQKVRWAKRKASAETKKQLSSLETPGGGE